MTSLYRCAQRPPDSRPLPTGAKTDSARPARRQGQLPGLLQHQLEAMSGLDLSDVQVHRNSSEPARHHANAITRDDRIHLAPAQDHLLPHEAWHAVQQKQHRVTANASFAGDRVNTSPALEREADSMAQRLSTAHSPSAKTPPRRRATATRGVVQMAPNQAGTADPQHLLDQVRALEARGLGRQEILDRISDSHGGNDHRYIYTDRHGWVDLRHFGAAGSWAMSTGSVITEGLGFLNEVVQWGSEWGDSYRSGFSPEDIPSNAAGAHFGDDFVSDDELLSASLERWLEDVGARDQDDPLAGRSSLPATDPAVRGGTDRGSSNASRTQSTVSDNDAVNELENECTSGWRELNTVGGWYRLFGL
ncbi:MAG: DUF4157 domain-containing protein [Pseudomonadota bacterium]